ncbi:MULTISPECIES: flagellar hook assembly protein FlgD [Salinivibrio]|jgi:flagellar basal-body rod modification protein FlgD|uniref:Basal-body rod modification protein FlgD n=1 Tax=Salinivibrio costicola subsp. alcaliphilus TaxID=272773 RepID=A0ABX3KTT2_SALCS|nr:MULTISPECIES: flagellar hook assembly protein FlgD [Salinivibrio]OOE93237.1 flagellar biosynthesis protein FlgD [Salinivibrio sp. AR647]OOE93539.1 flagellar biosynthesis protein FlgD [Salinivibrio sp. AR640]OOF07534.1 flagellar biosynthesis protein FlgD [Salinivibrio sp. MA440]OOF34862.1 flagellar biosynthesis protein FlgD [Salinivibrio costicola subsp. alcaliphilus]
MAGIDGTGSSNGLSYIDQLKAQQEKKLQEKQDSTTGKQALEQEDFLKLLTKQLSQQDPSKPVDNDKMISQMASFATVEGIGKMNKQFDTFNESITSNQALQASSLVGRDVLVPGSTGVKGETGGVAGMVKLPQALDNVSVRIENEQGQLLRTFSMGAKPPGDHRVEWDGMDDNGNPMPEGTYKLKVSGMVDGQTQEFDVSTYANVNSVLLGNGGGNVMLNIAGFSSPMKLAEVLEVGNADVGNVTKG